MPGSHVHKRACHVGSTVMKIEAAVFWADGKQGIKIAWPYEKNYNCILFIFVLLEFKGREIWEN